MSRGSRPFGGLADVSGTHVQSMRLGRLDPVHLARGRDALIHALYLIDQGCHAAASDAFIHTLYWTDQGVDAPTGAERLFVDVERLFVDVVCCIERASKGNAAGGKSKRCSDTNSFDVHDMVSFTCLSDRPIDDRSVNLLVAEVGQWFTIRMNSRWALAGKMIIGDTWKEVFGFYEDCPVSR